VDSDLSWRLGKLTNISWARVIGAVLCFKAGW
jgi:hypothetical protein